MLHFSCRLLGMSWLRRSQNDLLGEKGREMGRRRARKREREMRCHWGIPLSPPVFPPLLLSCPFNLPLSLSLLPLLLTLFSHFQCKLSPLCDPGHLALLFYLGLLLALSLVVYLSPPPLPLSPSLTVTAGMQLFNEPPLLAPLSIIALQSLHVVSLFIPTGHCVVSQQHSPVQ